MKHLIALSATLFSINAFSAQLECYNINNPESPAVYVSFEVDPVGYVEEMDMQDMQRGYLWPDGWSGRQANPGDYDKYSGRGGSKGKGKGR